MEATAIHLVSFCKEVSASHSVWTIHKDGHVPSVPDADGISAMPFWSSRNRAVDFLSEIDDFEGFIPLEIPWALFKTKWVSDLVEKRMVAGVSSVRSIPKNSSKKSNHASRLGYPHALSDMNVSEGNKRFLVTFTLAIASRIHQGASLA